MPLRIARTARWRASRWLARALLAASLILFGLAGTAARADLAALGDRLLERASQPARRIVDGSPQARISLDKIARSEHRFGQSLAISALNSDALQQDLVGVLRSIEVFTRTDREPQLGKRLEHLVGAAMGPVVKRAGHMFRGVEIDLELDDGTLVEVKGLAPGREKKVFDDALGQLKRRKSFDRPVMLVTDKPLPNHLLRRAFAELPGLRVQHLTRTGLREQRPPRADHPASAGRRNEAHR